MSEIRGVRHSTPTPEEGDAELCLAAHQPQPRTREATQGSSSDSFYSVLVHFPLLTAPTYRQTELESRAVFGSGGPSLKGLSWL